MTDSKDSTIIPETKERKYKSSPPITVPIKNEKLNGLEKYLHFLGLSTNQVLVISVSLLIPLVIYLMTPDGFASLIQKVVITFLTISYVNTRWQTQKSNKKKEEGLAEQFTLFPIEDTKAYQFFKNHQASYWTTEEIDFSEDVKQWSKLDPKIQRFIEKMFAFFASVDGIIVVDTAEISMKIARTKCEKL